MTDEIFVRPTHSPSPLARRLALPATGPGPLLQLDRVPARAVPDVPDADRRDALCVFDESGRSAQQVEFRGLETWRGVCFLMDEVLTWLLWYLCCAASSFMAIPYAPRLGFFSFFLVPRLGRATDISC